MAELISPPNSIAALAEGATRRSRSPKDGQDGSRKRRRKALACYDCKRRKLKCDRVYPACGRCQKGGYADTCAYDPRSLEASGDERASPSQADIEHPPSKGPYTGQAQVFFEKSVAAVSEPAQQRTESRLQLQERIAQLEGRIASLQQSRERPCGAHLPAGGGETQEKLKAQEFFSAADHSQSEQIVCRGKGLRTHYYGPSHPGVSAIHFPDLRSFIRGAVAQCPPLSRLHSDLDAIKKKRKSEIALLPQTQETHLIKLVPGRDTIEPLVHLYWDTFEFTYRVLHGPTFWREYETFWQAPQEGRPAFAAILLLMTAAVECVAVREPYSFVAESSAARALAISQIQACEAWFQRQSQKHITLSTYQIRCLLFIAKQMNIVKKKQAWSTAGALMRFGMACGLHRDPDVVVRSTSIFNKEMRRRLWATIVELELQASISRGFPSMSAGFSSDCAPPLNIPDEDIDESTEQLPKARPVRSFSRTSFLNVARRTLQMRVSLSTLINDIGQNLDHDEVLRYERKIIGALEAIPAWNDEVEHQESQASPAMAQALLSIQLRQYLILLHSPFARRIEPDPRYNYSRLACLKAASVILEHHSNLASVGIHGLAYFREDVFRAVFSICSIIHSLNIIENDMFTRALSSSLFPLLEKGIDMLEANVLRVGESYYQFWIACAAYSLISESSTELAWQKAVDRISKLGQKVLDCQTDWMTKGPELQDVSSIPADVADVSFDHDLSTVWHRKSVPKGTELIVTKASALVADAQLELLDYNDLSAWTFDDNSWNWGLVDFY